MYEFATEEGQRYKESRVILERALVVESDGIDETPRPGRRNVGGGAAATVAAHAEVAAAAAAAATAAAAAAAAVVAADAAMANA